MKRRLISLLLVVMLVFTLLPMSVLAADGLEQETGTIAVVVYGKSLTNVLDQKNLEAVKAGIISAVAAEPIPEVTFSLKKGDEPIESNFKLVEESFMKSVNYGFDSKNELIQWLGNHGVAFASTITPYLGLDNLAKYTKNAYRVYKMEVPVGDDYELDIKSLAADGYIVNEETMAARPFKSIEVKANETTYVGFEKTINAKSFDLSDMIDGTAQTIINNMPEGNIIEKGNKEAVQLAYKLFGKIADKLIEVAISSATKYFDFSINFPGIWLSAKAPGFSFKSVNYAGDVVADTSFIMVNRDELEKIVKAIIAVGKESFENAMNILGDEEIKPSWDDINLLNKEIVTWDSDANQIGINEDTAYGVLEAYLSLAYQSILPAAKNFMSDETDLRLPAILKATAGEDGVVTFTEDSNVTLVWGIDIIMNLMKKAAEITVDSGETLSELLADNEDTKKIKGIVDLTTALLQTLKDNETANEFVTNGAEAVKSAINTWIYPLLQNNELPAKLQEMVNVITGGKVENLTGPLKVINDLSGILPGHALLTAKMPAGYYLLMEISVPEGYVRNPVFYTIDVKWDTSKSIDQWIYVNVANVGIIGPYFAEGYYTFLRNNSLVKTSDKFIAALTNGTYANLIEKSLDSNNDYTVAIINYYAKFIFNNMGGNRSYESEEELAEALSKYLYSHGKNTQNLWIFANQVAGRQKDVITGNLDRGDDYWYFYNIKENLHTNGFDAIKAVLNGAANSMSEENVVSTAVKNVISTQVTIIDKVDSAITKATERYSAALKNVVTSTTKKVVSNVTTVAKNVVTSLLGKLFKR